MLDKTLIVIALVMYAGAAISLFLAVSSAVPLFHRIDPTKRFRVNLFPLLALTEWAYEDAAKSTFRSFGKRLCAALLMALVGSICAMSVLSP